MTKRPIGSTLNDNMFVPLNPRYKLHGTRKSGGSLFSFGDAMCIVSALAALAESHTRTQHAWLEELMVGPLGLEPRTKGFTVPRCFQQEWTISSPTSRRFTARIVRARDAQRLSLRTLKSSGSLCTFQKCTPGLAQGYRQPNCYGFPEFIPFISHLSVRTHHCDESPALTS